ncbi:MAG TPA: class I SAM-dependent methyltransferase [Verrucomicrobiae bacterium]|nr:class I SAM-dependent methyltransferase [Verrucomicrobiae bacterium]
MKPLDKFYQTLHKNEQSYSAGDYCMDNFWSCRPIRQWLEKRKGRSIQILDVGCGKGIFTRDFVNGVKNRWNIQPTRITGIDLVRSPGDLFAEISSKFEFIQHDTDGNPLPLPDSSFDFLSCNHVLEHVFETENLVREFNRVLAPDGICVIAVPNIAAWVNRIGFLWGNQPLGSELGTDKTTYGFRPVFLQKRLEAFRPSGHIRDFTPRGLMDLTTHCGFQTVGWWKQSHGFVAQLNKWAARNMAIVLRKAS